MAEGKVKIDVDLNEKGATSGIGRLKSALNGLESAGTKAGSVFKTHKPPKQQTPPKTPPKTPKI